MVVLLVVVVGLGCLYSCACVCWGGGGGGEGGVTSLVRMCVGADRIHSDVRCVYQTTCWPIDMNFPFCVVWRKDGYIQPVIKI